MKRIVKMTITPITFRSQTPVQTQGKAKKKEESIEEILKKEGVELPKLTPAQKGIGNGIFWAGGGFVFDRLLNLLPGKIFKTPIKQSLIINGAIGLAMGTYSFFKAKKLDKTQPAEKTAV